VGIGHLSTTPEYNTWVISPIVENKTQKTNIYTFRAACLDGVFDTGGRTYRKVQHFANFVLLFGALSRSLIKLQKVLLRCTNSTCKDLKNSGCQTSLVAHQSAGMYLQHRIHSFRDCSTGSVRSHHPLDFSRLKRRKRSPHHAPNHPLTPALAMQNTQLQSYRLPRYPIAVDSVPCPSLSCLV